MKKYDVTALGELLIDFTENGNPLLEAKPDGDRDFSFCREPGNEFAGIGTPLAVDSLTGDTN